MRVNRCAGLLVGVLLSTACATTRAPVTAVPPPPTPPPAALPAASAEPPREAVPSIEEAVADVRAYERDARAAGPDDPRAQEKILPAIRRWARWSQAMIDANRREDADALFVAIAETNEALRASGFGVRPRGLMRETFLFESLRVDVWEWSEPIRYYPDSDTMWRWATYNLYDGESLVGRIDLEMSNLVGPYFVLGGANARGHAQYVPYGEQHPGSRRVREDVMRVLRREAGPIISSRRGRVQTPPAPPPDTH
jgi:hypothetical protein